VNILARILATKREEIACARVEKPLAELERICARAAPARSFEAALRRADGQPMRAIAEVKRASPSAGPIRPGADPAAVARDYAAHGAAAISVLTDRSYFDGALEFLAAVRAEVAIPILRKDFLIDPYQLYEARAAGADAVLLIVAALDDQRLAEFASLTAQLGMDALIEVHSEAEAERALAVGARIIGVNHRDLVSFAIDRELCARLRPQVPRHAVLVAESGIRDAADVRALAAAGADAILVGEALMRARSPGQALAALLASDGPA
jgi:indole-3-glycerol phosphate synthase